MNQPAVSLLSRLRTPAPSELSRKCKCVSNHPSGKHRSRGSNHDTEPKSVKPEQRVREYPKEPFVVSNTDSFLSIIGKFMSILGKFDTQNRVTFGNCSKAKKKSIIDSGLVVVGLCH